MTIPKITPYSGGVANPDGSQTQTEFTQNMFDQLSYEAELSTELNSTVDGINETATQVDADATSAAQSAASADASASGLNYQGLWPDTSGSADKGDTYQTQVSGTPTGQYFTALQNTTVDPVNDDVNWREVVTADWAYENFTGGANLLSNINFQVTGDTSQPLPSAAPTDYPAGYQVFAGWFASDSVGVGGLTFVDGELNIASGVIYQDVSATGALTELQETDFTSSVSTKSGEISTSGISAALVGDVYRVSIDSSAVNVFSAKFAQEKVASRHDVNESGSTSLSAPFVNRVVSSALIDRPDSKFFGVRGGAASFINNKLVVNPNANDDTSSLQDMLDWSSETGKKVSVTGFVGVTNKLVHREFAKVHFDGYVVPLVSEWGGDEVVYEINSEFYDSLDPDLSSRYLTDTTELRGALRINPGFGMSVPAVGVRCERGAGVLIDNIYTHGTTKGGTFILLGYEWNIGRIIGTAPNDAEAGAQLFYCDTSDGNYKYIGGKGYSKGVVFDSNATGNSVDRSHVWGYTSADAIQGENNKLLIGYEMQGGFNTLNNCFADTIRRNDNNAPASYSNGGVGFYVNAFGNTLLNPLMLAQAVDGNEKAVNILVRKANTTITNSNISNTAAIEQEGEIRFEDAADITNTQISGGGAGLGWLYTTKDRPRNLSNNLTVSGSEPNQYQRLHYNIDKEIVTESIAVSQYIVDNTSTDAINFTLPDIFANCEGEFEVYDTDSFNNALVFDWVKVIALFRDGVIRFQRRKVDGTAETINQTYLKVSGGTGTSQTDMFSFKLNVLVTLPAR